MEELAFLDFTKIAICFIIVSITMLLFETYE